MIWQWCVAAMFPFLDVRKRLCLWFQANMLTYYLKENPREKKMNYTDELFMQIINGLLWT